MFLNAVIVFDKASWSGKGFVWRDVAASCEIGREPIKQELRET